MARLRNKPRHFSFHGQMLFGFLIFRCLTTRFLASTLRFPFGAIFRATFQAFVSSTTPRSKFRTLSGLRANQFTIFVTHSQHLHVMTFNSRPQSRNRILVGSVSDRYRGVLHVKLILLHPFLEGQVLIQFSLTGRTMDCCLENYRRIFLYGCT